MIYRRRNRRPSRTRCSSCSPELSRCKGPKVLFGARRRAATLTKNYKEPNVHDRRNPPPLRAAALIAGAIAPFAASAQNAPAPQVVQIEQIVVTGTRVPDRSSTETAVPVDVVS